MRADAARSEDLAFGGLCGQLEALARGAVSSRELVELSLERIEATQPTVNAFRLVLGDEALATADAADRRRAAGDDAPLLGVPVAIKDDVDLAGATTQVGCGGEFEPKLVDSEMVRRLKAAGADNDGGFVLG